MKKLFLVIFLLAASITSIHAKSVDSTLAKTIAKNLFYERVNIKHKLNYSDINISLAYTRQAGSTNVYYVFNITGKSNGFVIVSAEDAVYPILGYSLESNYVQENQPPAFVDWMDNYRNEIIYIKQNDIEYFSKFVSAYINMLVATIRTRVTNFIATKHYQNFKLEVYDIRTKYTSL